MTLDSVTSANYRTGALPLSTNATEPIPRGSRSTLLDGEGSSVRAALLGTCTTEIGFLVLGVLTSVVTARLLLPEGRGALAAVLFWPQLLASIGLLSLDGAVICRSGEHKDRRPEVLVSGLLLAAGLSTGTTILGFILMPELLGYVRGDLVTLARACLLVFVPLNILVMVLLAADLGGLAFARYNVLRVLIHAVYLGGLLALWFFGVGSVSLVVAANLAAIALVAVARLLLEGRGLAVRPSMREMRALLELAWRFHPATLLVVLTAYVDRFVVLLLWDNTTLGQYVAALALAGTALPMVAGAFQKVLVPHALHVPEAAHRAEVLARGVRQVTMSLAVLAVPLSAVTPWLLPLLFGSAFVDAIPVAIVLVMAFVLSSLKTFLIHALRVLHAPRQGVIGAMASLVLFSFLVWPFAHSAGLVGVGLALLVSECAGLCYLLWFFIRRHELAPRELWGLTFETLIEVYRVFGRVTVPPARSTS